ncbi:MAG: TldD/PmbA family protein [Candidatus Edwardsbacteria bacterium]|jgi:PmbA protein|nr:TldD/PmbA family protein [Candidatus Edwardsbacteria bacterium]
MEQLLALAAKAADQAEVFTHEQVTDTVTCQDARLHDIRTDFLSGVSLRIIKDGKLGFAYTRNLLDRQGLVDNALRSLEGGVEARYVLPAAAPASALDSYDDSVRSLTGAQLVDEARRVCDILKASPDGEIAVGVHTSRDSLRIINSAGADLTGRSTAAGTFGDIIYPGSGSGIGRAHYTKRLEPMPGGMIAEMVDLFGQGRRTVEPAGGRMRVLFMPGSMITLLWRLFSGLSGRSVYENISPLAGRAGQRLFSEQLTVIDDPLRDSVPGARAFDDEGVACRRLPLVERGVVRNFYCDLNHGAKLGMSSTGHGYRSGDPVTARPGPALTHCFIEPGAATLPQLVALMDRGIIVEGALGAHSGNIPNGDYSVGVSPGLYVEGGRIVGRVKDAMVSGNIYETLRDVIAVGDTPQPSFGGSWTPPVLCDGVSVTTKS